MFLQIAGKGDLVGCDISLNMMHGVNGQAGAGGTGAQDFILKSSSDVKVGHSLSYVNRLKCNQFFSFFSKGIDLL